jgi:hypothetical protein
MVVDFRAREISRGAYKLTWTLKLIKKKILNDNPCCYVICLSITKIGCKPILKCNKYS